METTKKCKLDVDRFRKAVVEKLVIMVGGEVKDTGYHLTPVDGQDDWGEVELAFRKFGHGYAAFVDGKQIRHVYAENDANTWTVAGEVMARLAEKKQRLERLRRQRADTEKCLVLLKDFPLSKEEKCRWNVHDGKVHFEVRASFGPDRIKAFIDMVELSRMTLEDGDVAPATEDDDGAASEGTMAA